MLDTETKVKLKDRLYPAADQVTFSPVFGALEQSMYPGARVLDAGCGKGSWVLRGYRQSIGLLVGIDSEVLYQRNIDKFIVGDLERLPIKDSTFDIIICYFVIEHLKNPKKVFAEFQRVLTEGGKIMFKTPCAASPMFVLSRYVPHQWQRIIKKAMQGTQESDIFPTYYRCNTQKKLDHALKRTGFQRVILKGIEQIYDYLTFSRSFYAIGLLTSRLMQFLPWTEPFRSQIIGVYCKPRNSTET
ncbi:MAG TPA: methyltransferase domain-containing protein [Dehalococcoidia bacterium]|nr:methyltransferase domain-containing protein [Dehalococcoidia bacterium]